MYQPLYNCFSRIDPVVGPTTSRARSLSTTCWARCCCCWALPAEQKRQSYIRASCDKRQRRAVSSSSFSLSGSLSLHQTSTPKHAPIIKTRDKRDRTTPKPHQPARDKKDGLPRLGCVLLGSQELRSLSRATSYVRTRVSSYRTNPMKPSRKNANETTTTNGERELSSSHYKKYMCIPSLSTCIDTKAVDAAGCSTPYS